MRAYLSEGKGEETEKICIVNAFLDYESPTNIAVRLRGEEF